MRVREGACIGVAHLFKANSLCEGKQKERFLQSRLLTCFRFSTYHLLFLSSQGEHPDANWQHVIEHRHADESAHLQHLGALDRVQEKRRKSEAS